MSDDPYFDNFKVYVEMAMLRRRGPKPDGAYDTEYFIQNPLPEKFRIDYNDRLYFDASIRMQKEVAYFEVNKGSAYALTDIVSSLCAMPDFMPEFRASRSPTVNDNFRRERFREYSWVLENPVGFTVQAAPACRLRQDLGDHLFQYALKFLMWHETAHLALGHFDYLNALYGASYRMSEVDSEQCSDTSRLRRLFEITADEFAVRSLLNIRELAPEAIDDDNGLQITQWADWDLLQSVSILIVLSLIYQVEKKNRFNASEERTHPLTGTRLMYSLTLIAKHYREKMGVVKAEPYVQKVFLSFFTIERLLNTTMLTEIDYMAANDADSKESIFANELSELMSMKQSYGELLKELSEAGMKKYFYMF